MSGGSLYSWSRFNAFSLIPFAGIAIFYGSGEWWRRKIVATHPEETNWLVLAVLIVGLIIFFVGSYLYLLSPAPVPDPVLLISGISAGLYWVRDFLLLREGAEEIPRSFSMRNPSSRRASINAYYSIDYCRAVRILLVRSLAISFRSARVLSCESTCRLLTQNVS